MALKLSEKNDGTLVDIGDVVRIEKRAFPEMKPFLNEHGEQMKHPQTGEPLLTTILDDDGNAVFKWVVYEAIETGVEHHEHALKAVKSGAHRNNDGMPRSEMVKKMGVHPHIKGPDGKGIPTNEEFIWVPAGVFASQEEALMHAKQLAGEGTPRKK